jgi:hypothetical protein
LGLKIEETSKSTLADGKTDAYDVTEGVKIRWKDRGTALPALLVPDAQDVLLGALPLNEAMDLIVDPVHKRLWRDLAATGLRISFTVSGVGLLIAAE